MMIARDGMSPTESRAWGAQARIAHVSPCWVRCLLLVAGAAVLNLTVGCSSRPVRYIHRWELVNSAGDVVETQEQATTSSTPYINPYQFDPRAEIVQGILSGVYRVVYTLIPDYGLGLFAYFGTVLDPDYRANEEADYQRTQEWNNRDRESDRATETPGDTDGGTGGGQEGGGGVGAENPG